MGYVVEAPRQDLTPAVEHAIVPHMTTPPKSITGIDVTGIDWTGPFIHIIDDLTELAYEHMPAWDDENVEAWAEKNATKYAEARHPRWDGMDEAGPEAYRLKEALAAERSEA